MLKTLKYPQYVVSLGISKYFSEAYADEKPLMYVYCSETGKITEEQLEDKYNYRNVWVSLKMENCLLLSPLGEVLLLHRHFPLELWEAYIHDNPNASVLKFIDNDDN